MAGVYSFSSAPGRGRVPYTASTVMAQEAPTSTEPAASAGQHRENSRRVII